MRFTSRNVLTIEPGEHRDAIVPGLILRVTETSRAWGFRYTFAGQRDRVSLGPLERDKGEDGKKLAADIERARNLARLLVAGLVRGEDPRATLNRHESSGLTVANVCDQALAGLKLRPATLADWHGRLKRDILGSPIADRPAASLNRAQIREWGEAIAKRSGYSANRSFEFLRRAYSWAVERDILQATPFVRLPKPFDGEQPKGQVMSPDELASLMAALDAEPCGYADIVWLLLFTGTRRSEAEGARFSEVSGDLWTIPAARSKNGIEHVVPLSTQALGVIARRRAGLSSEYLFPVTRGARGKAARVGPVRINPSYIAQLREHVGGSRWSLHSFRSALATHGQDVLGLDLSLISAILGHAAPDVSKTTRLYYAHGKQIDARRKALQAWADWLDLIRKSAPEWVNQREAAKILGLAESTLEYHRHRKQCAPYKIIRRVAWYKRADIEAWKVAKAGRLRGVAHSGPKSEKPTHRKKAA